MFEETKPSCSDEQQHCGGEPVRLEVVLQHLCTESKAYTSIFEVVFKYSSPPVKRSELEEIMRLIDLSACVSVCPSVCRPIHELAEIYTLTSAF